jgi:hypothetical protein
MKHQAGERIYQQLKGKSVQEQVVYWQNIEQKYFQLKQKDDQVKQVDRSGINNS